MGLRLGYDEEEGWKKKTTIDGFFHSFPLMNELLLFSFIRVVFFSKYKYMKCSFILLSSRSVDMFCAVVFEECPIKRGVEEEITVFNGLEVEFYEAMRVLAKINMKVVALRWGKKFLDLSQQRLIKTWIKTNKRKAFWVG